MFINTLVFAPVASGVSVNRGSCVSSLVGTRQRRVVKRARNILSSADVHAGMSPLPLETNDAVLRGPVLERWSPSRTSSASQSLPPLPGVSASGPRLPCLASPRSRPGVRRDDRERLGARAATSKMAPKLVGNPHCRRIISGAALSSLARTIKDASPPSCRPVLWITARHSSEPQQSAPNWNNKARLGAVLMTPRTSLYPREACVHPANNTTDFGASNDSFFSGRKAREQQRGRAAGPLSPNNPPRVSGNPSVKEGGGLRRKSRDRSMHQSSRRRGSGPRLIHEAVRPAGCGRRPGQRRGQGGRSMRTGLSADRCVTAMTTPSPSNRISWKDYAT